MIFMDAVNNMIEGKHLARSGWSGYYLVILSGQNFIWSVGKDSASATNAVIFIPSVDDLFANDWIVKT